jgi:hypothetical protein
MTARRRPPGLLATFALAVTVAACGSAAAPSPSPISLAPTPTPVPGAGGGGNTGGGVVPPPAGGGTEDPILGQATVVVAQPGQQNLHRANVQLVRATVDGKQINVELRWWSGVAPCTVLDSVEIFRDTTSFTLTVNEGSSGQPVACIDIAQLKATFTTVGLVDSGTYTIKAIGDAAPITVTVP